MLYVIAIEYSNRKDSKPIYSLFETHTESTFKADKRYIKWLLTKKVNIINASIEEDKVVIKPWPNILHTVLWDVSHYVHSGTNDILLCKLADNKFKTVDEQGQIRYVDEQQLKELISKELIANCQITDGVYKSIDTYKVDNDTKFVESIAKKYEKYKALTHALNKPMSFEYHIEGKEVRLTSYTGTAENIIVPNFITTIMSGVFNDVKAETIKLTNGLTHIGSYAFYNSDIPEIIIPETVKFIGRRAFAGNTNLIKASGTRDHNKLKIINKETVMINSYKTGMH